MNEKMKNPAPIEKKQDKTRTFGYLKQQFCNTIHDYCANEYATVKPQSLKDLHGCKNAKN